MLDIATISESVNNAAHEFPIKRVDLFGSYAEERQTEKSDVDLPMALYWMWEKR